MYVNVTLYKTKLSPTDTMVFSSKEEQTTFFNGLTKLDLGKCSFNGKRTIRINGNYFMLNIGGYNYIKIYYTDGNGNERTYYAFIDLFRYVNDNCCEVDVTTDYIQTYMFDIQFAQLFIEQRNYSINTLNFPQSKPFKNKYPTANYNEIYSKKLNSGYIAVIVLINNTTDTALYPVNFPLTHSAPDDANFTTQRAVSCAYWIYKVDYKYDRAIPSLTPVLGTKPAQIKFEDFIKRYQANIIDILFTDTIGCGKDLDGEPYIFGYQTKYNPVGDQLNAYTLTTYNGDSVPDEFLFDNNNRSILCSPYYNMYIYRPGRNKNLINIANILLQENPVNNIKIRYFMYFSVFPNYSTNIKLVDNLDKSEIFSIDSYAENVVFNVSAWEQYKLTNSATVGDALSTKHAYDLEIAERNYGNAKDIAAIKFGASGAQTAGSLMGSIAGGLLSVDPLKGASQIIGGIASAIGNTVGGGLTYAQELENADVAYKNTLTTIEQESALLQIGYNDIKNSPDQVKNLTGNGYTDVAVGREAAIAIYEATNINEIIKYHKRFGFETALQTEITDLAGLHDTNAQDFDYIRTLNCVVISENIPRTSADMIQKIFNSGIYLWRNYEKLGEDYLSNYEGE